VPKYQFVPMNIDLSSKLQNYSSCAPPEHKAPPDLFASYLKDTMNNNIKIFSAAVVFAIIPLVLNATIGTNREIDSSNTDPRASVDYHIKIDGVEGELTNPGTDDPGTMRIQVQTNVSDDATTTQERLNYDDSKAPGNETAKKEDAELESGNEVSVRATELRELNEEQKEAFMATVKTHAEVKSGQDLENFARGVMLENQAMEEISLSNEKISVKYESEGKLFGFIPISFYKNVEVDMNAGDGVDRVKVKFPWYRFMMKVDVGGDDLSESINTEIENIIGVATATSTLAETSLQGQINIMSRVITTLSNVLKRKHDTSKNTINNVR